MYDINQNSKLKLCLNTQFLEANFTKKKTDRMQSQRRVRLARLQWRAAGCGREGRGGHRARLLRVSACRPD